MSKRINFNFNTRNFSILGVIIFILVTFFIAPWLIFWVAYFSGWIAKITIGNYIVNGFNVVGITIAKDQIPLLAGILGWIGSFFTSLSTSKKGN